jgi:hypothetical protein
VVISWPLILEAEMETFPFLSLFRLYSWALLAGVALALVLRVASLVGCLPAFLNQPLLG